MVMSCTGDEVDLPGLIAEPLVGLVAVIWLLPPRVEVSAEGDYCKSPRRTAKDSATSQADKG